MNSEGSGRRITKTSVILYLLGFLLLVYAMVFTSDDKTAGLIALLAYIPLFVFARYLQRHGGMGWRWPD